jgi:hypothetical protein
MRIPVNACTPFDVGLACKDWNTLIIAVKAGATLEALEPFLPGCIRRAQFSPFRMGWKFIEWLGRSVMSVPRVGMCRLAVTSMEGSISCAADGKCVLGALNPARAELCRELVAYSLPFRIVRLATRFWAQFGRSKRSRLHGWPQRWLTSVQRYGSLLARISSEVARVAAAVGVAVAPVLGVTPLLVEDCGEGLAAEQDYIRHRLLTGRVSGRRMGFNARECGGTWQCCTGRRRCILGWRT